MEQEIRIINHPFGYQLTTPILVPSYSSKGFDLITKKDGEQISEVSLKMINCAQFLTEITLVSAYDLYYKLIPLPKEFNSTEFTIIDSGGYETSDYFDYSTPKKISKGVNEWDIKKYEAILNDWPEEYASIIVSFDKDYVGKPLEDQVDLANKLFQKFPRSVNDFLVKPFSKRGKPEKYIDVKKLVENIQLLKGFDIIGLTEKELGYSLLDRMNNIQSIRNALKKVGYNTPIHIFGSLDPITSILYFLSGADIFDGLTWIRYSYYKGVAIYPSNFSYLDPEGGINLLDHQAETSQLFNNLKVLKKIKLILETYIKTKDIQVFDDLGIPQFSELLTSSLKNLE